MVSKLTCISASNVRNKRHESASTRACLLVQEILQSNPDALIEVDILRLVDYELNPCQMCGNCFLTGECERDPAFNEIFNRLSDSDGLVVVCPHYAPIPSKLVMLLEKMEEIAYLNYCANPDYRFPLSGKPVGLIAHGGQGEDAVPYYCRALLEPLANAFSSLQMRVIPAGDDSPLGAAFGIRSISSQTDSVFVNIDHDWGAVRQRITPLVENLRRALLPA